MAHAQQTKDWSNREDPKSGAKSGDWNALRLDLKNLLEQVEGQAAIAQTASEALKENKQYLHQEQNSRPLETQYAQKERISEPVRQEGRARNNQQLSQTNYDKGFQNKESLTTAIHSISSRLERFENKLHSKSSNPDLNSSSSNNSGRFKNNIGNNISAGNLNLAAGDLEKIVEQIAQLTHVVELLSGAVGESGQVKRLEGQIDNIANLINENYNSSRDYSDISSNMIALANNVEQLGELQTQTSQSQQKLVQELTNNNTKDFGEDFENISRRIDILTQNINQLSELQTQSLNANDSKAIEENLKRYNETYENGLNSISISIGNIFERLDQMERSPSITPNDIERLFQEIRAVSSETALISQKIDAGQAKNDEYDLINRVDTLNDRLARVENIDLNVGDVSTDFINLREMIKDAIEPRFYNLQTRIEELGQYIANNSNVGVDGNNIPQQYQVSEGVLDEGILDNEQNIADTHVATTQIKVKHTGEQNQAISKSDELKEKLLQLKKSFEKGNLGSQKTVVDELQETKLQEFGQAADEQPLHVFLDEVEQNVEEVQAEPHRREVNVNAALAELAERHNKERARKLSMRSSNISQDEDQIQAKSQDTQQSNKITLQVKSVNKSPSDVGYSVDKQKSEAINNDNFNPADVERPAMPMSDFAPNAQAVFDSISAQKSQNKLVSESGLAGKPNSIENEVKAQSSRNTFIEAARRAANRQNIDQTAAESQSLIARAFTRFQKQSNSSNTSQEQSVTSNSDELSKANKKALKQSQKQAKSQNKVIAETQNLQNDPENSLGFAGIFTRYKKLGIIFVALVIVIILALNLIVGRTNNQPVASLPEKSTSENLLPSDQKTIVEVVPNDSVQETVAPLDSAPTQTSPAVNLSPIPKEIESVNTDAFTTGSIARNEDGAVVVKQEMPRSIDLTQGSQLSDDINTSSISNTKFSTVDAVQLEMPIMAVGPDELREAAAKGNARAQFEVAAIYGEGKALDQDFKSAAIWYERSAAQGFAPAGYRLGGLYENGQGVEKNLELARLWYQRSAEAGNRMAMHNLASLYAGTEMGEQDFFSALEWFERAAKNNLTDSQFNLGMLYARGLGTKQDLETAYFWFSVAARNGDKDAAKAQKDIARSLDSVTVGALQNKVANWQSEKMDIAANFAPIGTWSNNFNPGKDITNKQVIEKVQSVLLALGFDVGTPDGMMGPRTAQAIKEFEKETGMQPSGKVNPRLLAVLGSQPV